MFFTRYHSARLAPGQHGMVAGSEIDALIDAARATGDVAEQARIYKELQAIWPISWFGPCWRRPGSMR